MAESKLLLLDESNGFSPLREQIQAPLLIVMAMVGLVVLMACVNVSSLLLVRAAARVKEMSIRYAMGAGRGQIIRQLLVEGLLLGLLGGLTGLLFAPLVSAFLVRRIAGDTATEMPFSAHPDLRILLFNFGLAFLVSVLFSLAPALRFLHPDLVNSLKQQTYDRLRRTSALPARLCRRTDWPEPVAADWSGIVRPDVAQPAFSERRICYRSSADLRCRSHSRRLRSEAGRPLAETSLGSSGGAAGSARGRRHRRSGAGGQQRDQQHLVRRPSSKPDEDTQSEWQAITPTYFSTMNIPLLAGRTFTEQDMESKAKVAIVNANLARKYFGDPKNAVGQLMARGSGSDVKFDIEIIGVVGDTRHRDMRTDVLLTVYRPYSQNDPFGFMQYYVRTWQAPEAAEMTMRRGSPAGGFQAGD